MRPIPKGRAVDPRALAKVRALLGDAPRRRDLLIEFLHRIQDRHYCISAAHLVALASEMELAMAEIYEVATFYQVAEKRSERRQDEAREAEKAECVDIYMSILTSRVMKYWQAQ